MSQLHVMEGTGEELVQWLNQQPKERFRLIKLTDVTSFMTYEESFTKATSRTHKEIRAARDRVLEASPPPHELPEGKTLEDMVLGRWPGKETDEEILTALEKLS